MRQTSGSLRKQSGVAIITALLLTTLAITIVASLFWQQQVQVRSIENQRMQLQKQWILRGALDWARLILREDDLRSSIDHMDEPWATPLASTELDQYVENGRNDNDPSEASLSGNILDAQARYNLRNLVQGTVIVPSELAVLTKLFSNVKLPPTLAQGVAAIMLRAQQVPDPTLANANPSETLPLTITQVNDLLIVPGMTPEMLQTLREFVIVLPRATPVNVNTASAEVLSARIATLTLADAALIVGGRRPVYFRNNAEFIARLPPQGGQALPTISELEVGVKSQFFLVNGDVRLSHAALQVQSLIERAPGVTRVVWIREN